MECTIDPREDAGYRGKNFFTKDILPQKLLARSFVLEGPRVFKEDEDVVILYVERGRGILTVNNQEYRVEPGVLIVLYPSHIQKLNVTGARKLAGVECVVNIGTLLYMFAIPSHRRPVKALGRTPDLYFLGKEERETVEELWKELLEENRILDCYAERMQLSLLMQILVISSRGEAAGPAQMLESGLKDIIR